MLNLWGAFLIQVTTGSDKVQLGREGVPHITAAGIQQTHQVGKQGWQTTRAQPYPGQRGWQQGPAPALRSGQVLDVMSREFFSRVLKALIRSSPAFTPLLHTCLPSLHAHTSQCGNLRSQLTRQWLTLESQGQLAWDRCKKPNIVEF